MTKISLLIAGFIVMSGCSHDSRRNELRRLFDDDQAARLQPADGKNWDDISKDDQRRREMVLEILTRGNIRSAEDYFHAGFIFQHGLTSDDYRLAHSLATIAFALDPKSSDAGWLVAATWDRLMMSYGKPQWYGTQFFSLSVDGAEGEMQLYDFDKSAVSDEERMKFSVPPVDDARTRIEQLKK